MDNVKDRLHQLDDLQLRQLLDSSSETFRALQELVIQLRQLETDLDKGPDKVYNGEYKPMYVHQRAYHDMLFYGKLMEGFRDLAMERFVDDEKGK